MLDEHPNISVVKEFNAADIAGSADVIADDFVWHYFNPQLPDIQGDYTGLDGLNAFFGELSKKMEGTFEVNPVSVTAMGDELVVVHVKNTMLHSGRRIEVDAVVVWRIVEGRVAEAWDIPAVNTVKNSVV